MYTQAMDTAGKDGEGLAPKAVRLSDLKALRRQR